MYDSIVCAVPISSCENTCSAIRDLLIVAPFWLIRASNTRRSRGVNSTNWPFTCFSAFAPAYVA